MYRVLIFLLILFSNPIIGQIELNIGAGLNYNLGFYKGVDASRERGIGRVLEVSGAYRESENFYYRVTLQSVDNIWVEDYDILAGERDLVRNRYFNIIPTIEYLPGRTIGFSGGMYCGVLSSEHIKSAGTKKWKQHRRSPPTRKLDPGVVVGTNLYLGSVSVSLLYTVGLFTIRKVLPRDQVSGFTLPAQINSGLQFKVGYFFEVADKPGVDDDDL